MMCCLASRCRRLQSLGAISCLALLIPRASAGDSLPPSKSIFARENLVAWCIVPFDANQRGPAERAAMVHRLGFKRVAYDWRDSNVPQFEEEIIQYKKLNIEYFAFWGWHERMAELIPKYGIHPQIWFMAPSPPGDTQRARVEGAAQSLASIVETTRRLGLQLALYNHGDWGGEPANLAAVCEHLRQQGHAHVGIVYNFHHGHAHIADFPEALALMKPYLLCLNLNGMNDGENPKILPIGAGQHEARMMQAVLDSGYDGPIGIIHHREQLDAEQGLRQNLLGLQTVLQSLGDSAALATFDEASE